MTNQANRLKTWTSLAAQTNHNMNMVTIADPVTTDASIAIVVDLNTLYKNAMAKKTILVRATQSLVPVVRVPGEYHFDLPPHEHCIRKAVKRGKGSHPEICPRQFKI